MINIENTTFNTIRPVIEAAFPGAFVTGEYVRTPPSFPCVSIIEESNTTYQRSLTAELRENHAFVMHQVEIYSNLDTGKKSQCQAIQSVVDAAYFKLGFIRIFSQPTPNYEDATIFRITSRYQAIVSHDGIIYKS